MLSFGVKIAKIGPVDLEIICLREIIKKMIYNKRKKRKKRRVKYIALSATFAERAKRGSVVCKTRLVYTCI